MIQPVTSHARSVAAAYNQLLAVERGLAGHEWLPLPAAGVWTSRGLRPPPRPTLLAHAAARQVWPRTPSTTPDATSGTSSTGCTWSTPPAGSCNAPPSPPARRPSWTPSARPNPHGYFEFAGPTNAWSRIPVQPASNVVTLRPREQLGDPHRLGKRKARGLRGRIDSKFSQNVIVTPEGTLFDRRQLM
jgi:hypothetical protein